MDVSKILAELKAERQQIEEAILSLERLARGRQHRGPGRPPNVMPDFSAPKKRGRPPGSKNKVPPVAPQPVAQQTVAAGASGD
jgi:hypothetical protein